MDKKEEKKTNYSKIIVVIILLVVVAAAVFILNKKGNDRDVPNESEILYKEEEDGTRTNVSTKLAEEKKIDGLRLTNIQLIYKDNSSYLKADVVNTTQEKSGDFNVNLKIVDQNNQEIFTFVAYIPPVEPGETTLLDASITTDITGAYNFEVSRAQIN